MQSVCSSPDDEYRMQKGVAGPNEQVAWRLGRATMVVMHSLLFSLE